jgi:putative spermidine/putrescine transport system substrate-binding protein
MTSAYSGGILDAIKKRNENLAIVWDSRVWDMVVWVIPKGGVNFKEAMDFIVFASDPKRMAAHANYISYAPVRKSAVAYLDDRVRKYIPTTKKNVGKILRIDHKWWITHEKATEIAARFAQWRIEKPWRPNFNPPDES